MSTEKAVVGMPYARSPFLYSDEGVVESNSMPRRSGVFCKINTVIFVALAFFTINAVFADPVAQNTSSLPNEEREAILDMIAQINHINWVVCTIKSYNNIIVLEEEYEKISPGNLDLSRIPNEETLKRITRMLDTLYSLRRDDRQMKRWREDFKERRRREQKTYLLKASKQAVDTLTEQAKECCSLWSWASNPAGSILNVAHTAFNMTHYSVSLYNDYDNFIYDLDKSASDKQFDFDSAKLDLLHKQNKEILEDQWSFIRRYKLDDRLRVSDVDIKLLLKCLKTENHEQLYIRLLPMRERFSLFPEYWYYLSCVAMETGHFKEGIEACDTFFRVNRRIFRDDPMEGTVAFNKAFMLSKTDANKQEVRKCLELAWKNNIIRGDWQLDYLAAIMHKGVFNEQAKAEMMLEHAVALIEQETREQVRYGNKAGVTLEEGLHNCRNALHELRGEPLEGNPKEEEDEIVSSIIASQSNVNLVAFKPAEEFIEVRVPYNEHLQDFSKYGLKIMEGDICVQELRGYTSSEMSRTCRISSDGSCLILNFPFRGKPSNVYTFRLSYYDSSYPVEWTIVNIIGEDELSRIAEGRLNNDRLVRLNRSFSKVVDMFAPLPGSNQLLIKGWEQSAQSLTVSELKESWNGCSFYFYTVVVKGQEHKYTYTDQELGINDVTLDNAEFRRKVVDRDVEAKSKL